MFNPQTAPYAEYYLQPLEVAAPKFGVKPFKAASATMPTSKQLLHG